MIRFVTGRTIAPATGNQASSTGSETIIV